MPKRKDSPKRDDLPAKIDAAILRDARIVAAYRDITLAEYLSETLRPIVAGDLESEAAKKQQPRAPMAEQGASAAPKSKRRGTK